MMKVLKRLLKILGYAVVTVLAILILLALFTQTQFFRDRMRGLLVSSLSTRLNGNLQLGTIHGNFLNGLTIDSVVIYSDEGTFLTVGKITFQYDPLTLFQKKLSMSHLIIEQPTVHFICSSTGDWNFNKLFKLAEDTSTSAFNWTIDLNDIELKKATITVMDSASLASSIHWNLPETFVEYHNFSINDLNLKFNAVIKSNEIRAHIIQSNFHSPQSQFKLTQLKGDFTLTEKEVRATNTIIQTSHSYLELDASMKDINLFKGVKLSELQHNTTHLQLRAKNIDFQELRSFIPQVYFLDGSAFVDLEAGGEFGNLNIKHLDVQTFESSFKFSGNILNLHEPEKLYLEVIIGESKFTPADASKLLPAFNLPRFHNMRQCTFFAEFTGKPINFKTKASLKGSAGSIEINGEMNLEQPIPTYEATFTTNRLDLGKLFDEEKFPTSLTTGGKISGEGFSLNNITARLELKIDSSLIQNNPLTASKISIDALPKHLNGNAILISNEMKAVIDAQGDFSNPNRPQFGGNISFISLNLAKIFSDDKYQSNITFDAKLSGDGNNIDNLTTDITATLFPSTFRGKDIAEEQIHILLNQQSANSKHLSIKSQIADIDLSGKYDLDLMIPAFVHQTKNLVETIKMHAMKYPEVKKVSFNVPNTRIHTLSQQEMDFQYNLDIKNLEPLSTILGETPFNTDARLNGSVKGNINNLSISSFGTFNEFYIGTTKGGILLNGGTITLEIDSLSDTRTLEQLFEKAEISVDSGLLNTKKINNLHFALQYKKLAGKLTFQSKIDSIYEIKTSGGVSIQPHTYVFDFDTVDFRSGDYTWNNEQDVQLRLNDEGLRVMRLAMKRNNEALFLAGSLSEADEFDFDATLRNFDLAGIYIWLNNSEMSSTGQGFTGRTDLDIHLGGSTTSPVINLNANCDDTYFRQTQIGMINALINYKDQSAKMDINVKRTKADSTPYLKVKGTLPINLAFSGATERFPIQEQHIQLISNDFDISVLDPLLKDFENLKGTINCNVEIAGTPQNPEYNGTITLNDINLQLTANNINYNISGELKPSGNKILLKKFSVKNFRDKGKEGTADFSGSISIKNFRIDSFDILATGQLLLMTEATRKTNPNMYGTLFTEIGPEGLSLKGTFDRPYLSGILHILEANLVFPPTQAVEETNSNLSLKYVVINDTTKTNSTELKQSKFYAVIDSLNKFKAELGKNSESPLLDRLRYNLNIETHGPTAITMIFKQASSEELYAELDGKVTAINEQGKPTIYGDIEVSPRSYYNFYKKFDATGKMKFIGQWDNPELDIQATYEDVGTIPTEQKPAEQKTSGESPQITEQKVIVELKITGTRYVPKLDMAMKVQLKPGEEPVDWSTRSKDVQSDAISFIIFRKFRDQLTSKEQQEFTNLGSSTGSSVASSLLSNIFSDVLQREFPYIRRVEVGYRGGSFQEGTSVNVTATLGKGYLKVGGKILNDIGNTNVSYQLNIGDVLNSTTIRNLYLEILRKVEGDNPEDKKLTNEARLYYRFSF